MIKRLVLLVALVGAGFTHAAPASADSQVRKAIYEGDSCTHDLHAKAGHVDVTRSGRRVRIHVRATVGPGDTYDIELYRTQCNIVDASDSFSAEGDGTINKTVTFHVPTKYDRFFIAVGDATLSSGYLETHYFQLSP